MNKNSFNLKPPRVSILVPCYNQGYCILETLQSIENQKYENFEVLISDDCSTDTTASKVIDFISGKKIFHFYQQKQNLGITANYNFLASKASGKYISIFSGDDVMLADKIGLQVECLEKNPTATFCHHSVYDLDQLTGKIRGIISHSYVNHTTTAHDILRNLGIPGFMSVMYRKKYSETPPFRKEIATASDWYHLIELAIKGPGIYIENPLCLYRNDRNYNNKNVQKYEIDFELTIDLALEQLAPLDPAISKSCEIALSRYRLGAAYRALLTSERRLALQYIKPKPANIKLKIVALAILILAHTPISGKFLNKIKASTKKLLRL